MVCLYSPPPPWLYSSHGTPTPTTTPLSLHSTPPAPPLCALSGHPPCLFRWNRRGNESQSPLLTHSWDFALLLCAFLLFSTLLFPRFDDDLCLYQEAVAMLVLFSYGMVKKITCTEDATKNTSESQLLQIRSSEKAAPQLKIITVFYLMCSLGYSCMCDFAEKMLRQMKLEFISISCSVCKRFTLSQMHMTFCVCTL